MSNATITAQAPSYATDGSHGFFLEAPTASGNRVTGWIRTGDDARTVYASIDGGSWRGVGVVDSPAELTTAWIAEHADTILGRR